MRERVKEEDVERNREAAARPIDNAPY